MIDADNGSQDAMAYTDDREEYRRVFRRQVFQLLKWGYERMDSTEHQSAEEEEITGELAKEINTLVQDRSFPPWVGSFTVQEEHRINVDGRKGKRRKRLDIIFIYVHHGPRPRFPFEAKRLSVGTHVIGQYLGPEGLGEFLRGDYGRDAQEGGMIGYVQTGTPEEWAQKAEKKLTKAPHDYQLCHDGQWMYVRIVQDLDHCYRSMHHRDIGKSPISIYHSFLNFT